MNKGLGQKIGIKFTEKLTGDVTGLVPAPIAIGDYFRPTGIATASSQYSSSYSASKVFDGSTGSQWYTRNDVVQWIQIQLDAPEWIFGFRWYVGSLYRPGSFVLEGSFDGLEWDNLMENTSPNETGWHEFKLNSPRYYSYFRWNITSKYSSSGLYIYEIELLEATGNDAAFIVTGEEYQYVNGPLIPMTYKVLSVERHPDYRDDQHLLLTMHPQGRFNNVIGSLSVEYLQSIGMLRGRGGPVDGFVKTFIPTELASKPNPVIQESIETKAISEISFIGVINKYGYGVDNISVSTNVSIDFIDVRIINP